MSDETTETVTLASDDHDDGHKHIHGLPTPILFIFGCCAVGALSRTILKKVPQLPYTVMLLICGFIFGLVSTKFEVLQSYTTMAYMDPHTILHAFLPVLLFESAYAMEAHTFLKSFLQIILLAVPGLAISSLLTAVFCKNVYMYNWGWTISLMFGSLISCTDPVAVVAVLKELGASKQLGILLEGESLLNDGAAIVFFSIFNTLATPGSNLTGVEIFQVFLRKAFGGPLFGFVMSKLTIFWLVNTYNDALTEITITLASTYITFYIGEGIFDASGTLAVVVLGVVVSSNKTSISPEVETFLHRFWEMLAYLANTLIFILVGVVIAVKAAANATAKDAVLIISLYCAITVIRAVTILLFSPILKRIGYGLTWRNSTLMVWGGLRGAVGLALALIVVQNESLDSTGATQNIILLHTAGIVLLTLLINGTTIQPLLNVLGMSEVSIPKRMAMASAVRALDDVVTTSLSLYKTDRFLADADWDIIGKYITVTDPYKTLDEEAELDQLTNFERTSKCPRCTSEVPNEPSPLEMKEMRNEARLRLLKAEKITYWKQFEHGMLSREAVRKLNDLVDHAADTANLMVDTDEISKTWKMKGLWDHVRKYLEKLTKTGRQTVETIIPIPSNKYLRVMYKICTHTAFEILLNIIILCNVVSIIYELIEENTLCATEFDAKYGNSLKIINYMFISIYALEAKVKITGLRKWYFKSKWNIFDFIVLWFSITDIILELTLFSMLESEEDCTTSTSFFSPSIFRIAKSVRLLRLLRSFRLAKVLIPQLIDSIDRIISKKLRFGYDVGKGYVMGEEEVMNFLELMIDNKTIVEEFKERLTIGRMEITKELGMLQKKHPGVAVSIKTQQGARRILNNIQEKIFEMKGEGVIDDKESDRLLTMVEIHMKHLMKIPPSIAPPPAEKIIGNLSWVQGDAVLINYIQHNAELVSLQDGEKLLVESDPKGGIYVIVCGLVKVDKYIGGTGIDFTSGDMSSLSQTDIPKVSDYMSTGSVLGEYALLTGKPNNIVITCETSTQLYHISYEAIQGALELFIEEPSLEYRLWRVCAIRVATAIVKHMPQYLVWSPERLKFQMEKCVLCIEKSEMPEGGKAVEFQVFDIGTYEELCDCLLIHGVADDPDSDTEYRGPCFIPTKVQKLVLIPGKTEKHVIFLLPRDNTGADNTAMISEALESAAKTKSHGSATILPLCSFNKMASQQFHHHSSNSTLCLNHAAKERDYIMKRLSSVRMAHASKSSLPGQLLKKLSDHHVEEEDDIEMARVTNYVEAEDYKKKYPLTKKSKSAIDTSKNTQKSDKPDKSVPETKETFPPLPSKPSSLIANVPAITGINTKTVDNTKPSGSSNTSTSKSTEKKQLKTNKVTPVTDMANRSPVALVEGTSASFPDTVKTGGTTVKTNVPSSNSDKIQTKSNNVRQESLNASTLQTTVVSRPNSGEERLKSPQRTAVSPSLTPVEASSKDFLKG